MKKFKVPEVFNPQFASVNKDFLNFPVTQKFAF